MIPGVIPLVLAAAGVLALGVATAILRSFGSGYRVGRILGSTPTVTVAEAVRMARLGETGYVRIDGRIDSDEEFEDYAHRPLVYRRTTAQAGPADARTAASAPDRAWTTFDSWVEVVPFSIREGLDEIAVQGDALAEGLVVVRRESNGVAGDLGERAPANIDAAAPVRAIVQFVSSVEHGTVLGVPSRAADGTVMIGPGLGKPLILTTLEIDEAMRVLTGGATRKARMAVAGLVAGVALLSLAALWWLVGTVLGSGVATVLAASPEPSVRPGGDTRTTGAGPGLVGDHGFAILVVAGIALASVLGTLAWVRATGGRGARS